MPLFETKRLLVRELATYDAEALFRIFGNPKVTRWMGDGNPLTREQCEKWIEISQNNYRTKGFGASAVIERETNCVVGLCGIIYAPESDQPEIIYAFDPEHWGRGFAGEVIPAMLAYGVDQCGLPQIMATIHPDNKVSQRIAERAGMRFDRVEQNDDGSETICFVTEARTT